MAGMRYVRDKDRLSNKDGVKEKEKRALELIVIFQGIL